MDGADGIEGAEEANGSILGGIVFAFGIGGGFFLRCFMRSTNWGENP